MRIPKEEYELHPRGMFNSRVKQVIENESGQFGPYLNIVYQTPEGEVWDNCSAKIRPTTKLTERICGILNTTFQEIPADFDTDDLAGHLCQVFVDHVEKNGKTYANVINVIPFEEGGNGGRQPQPPPTDDFQAEADIPF